jgi:hypothetical protein
VAPVAPAVVPWDQTTYFFVPVGQIVADHARVMTRVALFTHMNRSPIVVAFVAAVAGAAVRPAAATSTAAHTPVVVRRPTASGCADLMETSQSGTRPGTAIAIATRDASGADAGVAVRATTPPNDTIL